MVRENEIAKIIIDAVFHVHRKLGPGLLESVYEAILALELKKRGLRLETQVPVSVKWDELILDVGFRADLIVENCVVLELKSVEKMQAVHRKQLLTYLRLTNCRLGLLINFNTQLVRDGIARVVNGLPKTSLLRRSAVA